MPRTRIQLAALLLACLVGVGACSTDPAQQELPSSDQVVTTVMGPPLGACEIDYDDPLRPPRPAVTKDAPVVRADNGAVVYVNGDIEAGAIVTTYGKDACVLVTGDIHSDATVVTVGERSTVFALGMIATNAMVHVRGQDSVLWVKAYDGASLPPGVSVYGPANCRLWAGDGEVGQ